jgi:hypothetical protein
VARHVRRRDVCQGVAHERARVCAVCALSGRQPSGNHAHGLSKGEFWALVRAMQGDQDKEAAFLSLANHGFRDFYEAATGEQIGKRVVRRGS